MRKNRKTDKRVFEGKRGGWGEGAGVGKGELKV